MKDEPTYISDPVTPEGRLLLHNEWRRGDIDLDPNGWHTPTVIGESIDAVLAELARLRTELARREARVKELESECFRLAEREADLGTDLDAAEARVKELESERENWRLSSVCREKDARLRAVTEAAKCVVARWETPLWKEAEPTASLIYRLRDALDAAKSGEIPPHPDSERLDAILTLAGIDIIAKCHECGGKYLTNRAEIDAAIDSARNGGNQS